MQTSPISRICDIGDLAKILDSRVYILWIRYDFVNSDFRIYECQHTNTGPKFTRRKNQRSSSLDALEIQRLGSKIFLNNSSKSEGIFFCCIPVDQGFNVEIGKQLRNEILDILGLNP